MPAGYSGTPLAKKLGIKPGHRVALLGAPSGYDRTLGDLPAGVTVLRRLADGLDVAQLFVRDRDRLEREFPRARERLKPAGALWVSWPKKTSRLAGELDGNVVREAGLANGLVDVKVCAVDEDWSGLKFVRRVGDR